VRDAVDMSVEETSTTGATNEMFSVRRIKLV